MLHLTTSHEDKQNVFEQDKPTSNPNCNHRCYKILQHILQVVSTSNAKWSFQDYISHANMQWISAKHFFINQTMNSFVLLSNRVRLIFFRFFRDFLRWKMHIQDRDLLFLLPFFQEKQVHPVINKNLLRVITPDNPFDCVELQSNWRQNWATNQIVQWSSFGVFHLLSTTSDVWFVR